MRILVIASHPDDETLGCGAQIALHRDAGDDVRVAVVADGVSGYKWSREQSIVKARQRRKDEFMAAMEILGVSDIVYLGLVEPLFLKQQAVKSFVRELLAFDPHAVYTHMPTDRDDDHKMVAQSVLIETRFWARPFASLEAVYGFPIPPVNDTSRLTVVRGFHVETMERRKIAAWNCYVSEQERIGDRVHHPRTGPNLRSQAHVWGSWIGQPYGEAFEPLAARVS